MKLLCLTENYLESNGAQYLSKCIHKIEKLELETCQIEEEGVQALAEQINKRKEQVLELFSLIKKNKTSNQKQKSRMIHVLKDCMSNQRCLEARVQKSTLAGVRKFKQGPERFGCHLFYFKQ